MSKQFNPALLKVRLKPGNRSKTYLLPLGDNVSVPVSSYALHALWREWAGTSTAAKLPTTAGELSQAIRETGRIVEVRDIKGIVPEQANQLLEWIQRYDLAVEKFRLENARPAMRDHVSEQSMRGGPGHAHAPTATHSLRDVLAAAALTGILAKHGSELCDVGLVAERAYACADAMLDAR